MGLLSSIFGGGGSSASTSTTKKTVTSTDDSVADLSASGGGVALVKKGRGRQKVVFNGLQGDALSSVIGALSGGTSAALDQARAANATVEDLARSATGSQSEAGKLIGSLALPVLIVAGLWLFFRKRK
jgi:hypothetical protein